MDRKGPTALLISVNSIDLARIANGINLNLQFDRALLKGEKGLSSRNPAAPEHLQGSNIMQHWYSRFGWKTPA